MTRFSLATLVLATFWIGAVALVWVRREPWCVGAIVADCPPGTVAAGEESPDRTRRVSNFMGAIQISERATEEPLAGFPLVCHRVRGRVAFVTNDQVVVPYLRERPETAAEAAENGNETPGVRVGPEKDYVLLQRRFPEWWWGHFFRPEVWLALALTAALGWRGAVKMKNDN